MNSIISLDRHISNAVQKCNLSLCYTIQLKNIDYVTEMLAFVKSLKIVNKYHILTFKFVNGDNGFRCNEDQVSNLMEKLSKGIDIDDKKISNIEYSNRFLRKYSNIRDIVDGLPF